MVTLTRLDGSTVVLNADLIETIEAVPDTVVTLTNHKKIVVREAVPAVVERVVAYQRAVHCAEVRDLGAALTVPQEAEARVPPHQGR